MFASKNGHLNTVKMLIKLGAKLNATNSSGMTAISLLIVVSLFTYFIILFMFAFFILFIFIIYLTRRT